MKIDSILVNMGEHKLEDVFLSDTCIATLKALDPTAVEPERLRQIVIDKVPESQMLRDRSIRRALIMALKKKAIYDLAHDLGVQDVPGIDLYAKISRMTFRRNSEMEKALFRFFGVAWDEDAESLPTRRSVETVSPARPLFDYQTAAISKIRNSLGPPGSRALLHMPTGAGKTRMAMRYVADVLLSDPQALVIWLAHSEELCEQAIEEFAATWSGAGDRGISVYRFYGGHTSDLLSKDHGTGLIVAGLSKMYRRAQTDDMFLTTLADRASLVVVDEAHQAVAETYGFVLDSLVEKHGARLLGLSATPGRTWNDRSKDEALAAFFHRNKVTLDAGENPIAFLVEHGFIAKQNVERLKYKDVLTPRDLKCLDSSDDIPQSVLDKLASDVLRNIMIISKLETMVRQGHTRIIYFATSISNARDISLTLHARHHYSFFVDAATPRSTRNRIIDEYRSPSKLPMIICNFGVLVAGFDAPMTTAVLIARPTRSLVLYSQMVGRAIRGPRVGGTQECVIVTVVDTSLPGFDSMVAAFANWEDVWD